MNQVCNRKERLQIVFGTMLAAAIINCCSGQSPKPDALMAKPAPKTAIGSDALPAAATIHPMSIGPAPGMFAPPVYYPPMVVGFNGRPVLVGPPAYPMMPVVPAAPVYDTALYPTPTRAASPFEGSPSRGRSSLAMRSAPQTGPTPQPVPETNAYYPPMTQSGPTPVNVEVRRPVGPANFRLSVSESFMNRLIAQERVDPGPVDDVILGAKVTGQQTTVSRIRADLVPSFDKARIALVLNGDVQSLTKGVTPQAVIGTLGQQQFVGVKEVYFDGVQLTTRHATVYIRARNQTVGAVTPLSGTLFGGLADRIAFGVAERQKSAGEAVARDRLAERLFPTFDGEVDEKLAQANRQLSPLRKQLESSKLLPSTQSVWTTDTNLVYEGFLGDEKTAPSIGTLPDPVEGERGLRFSIHESLMNSLIDRLGLKGYKTTDRELRDLEKSFLSLMGAQAPEDSPKDSDGPDLLPQLPGKDSLVTDIEFDDVEPMTVKVEPDRLVVKIKAHFKPAGQAVLPPMEVTIPYQTKLVGSKIRLAAGQVRVVAQDRADPEEPPTLMETMVQKVIEGDLIPLEFDRELPASLWTAAGPRPQVTAIKSENAWVTFSIE